MFSKHDQLRGYDDALSGGICDSFDELDNPALIARVGGQVAQLCASFPVYAD